MSRLAFLRKGVPENKITVIPGTKEKVTMVALNNKQIINAREDAIKYLSERTLDSDTQDLVLNMYILKECLRVNEDLNIHYIDNIDEILEYMDVYMVNVLINEYLELQSGSIPEFQDLTLEEFEDIKKKLEMMDLKELDGKLRTTLKHFLVQMNLRDLLMDN